MPCNHEKFCSLNSKRMKKGITRQSGCFKLLISLMHFAHQLWRFGVNWKTSLYLANYIKMFEFTHNFSIDEWLQSLPNAMKMNKWLIITERQYLSSSASFICIKYQICYIWRFLEYYTSLNDDKSFLLKINTKYNR